MLHISSPSNIICFYIIANEILSWQKVRSLSVGLLEVSEKKNLLSSNSQVWKRATGLEANHPFIHSPIQHIERQALF